jgi:hypothetical protein
VKADAGNPANKTIVDLVNDEIDALVVLAETERADAMGEILAQDFGFLGEFLGVLSANSATHPRTASLMSACALIALAAAQHFKRLNDRRRPAQVCAALRPPVPPPGHSAYPSGHATQAFLIARALQQALGAKPQAAAVPAINALAERIGRNREIAGLHYRSDTEGGKRLAGALFAALQGLALFNEAIAAAAAEWN